MKNIIKTLPVNVVGFLSDVSSMYTLNHFTGLSINYQVYISSMIRIFVLYLGHLNYTFKHSKEYYYVIASKFFPWEIFSMIAVNEMVILLNKLIIYEINELDLHNLREILINKKNNDLNPTFIIIMKQILIILFYVIVEVRIYDKIF
jgi:hypothetical protein